MQYGPNRILRTPRNSLVKIMWPLSGNTFGARYWTDGKCEAPMMEDVLWLQRIPDNDELFWTDECLEIGTEEPWSSAPNVPFAEIPTDEDYKRALATGLASSPDKERYIRMRLWWYANERVRWRAVPAPTDPDFRDNLLKFIPLLDASDEDQRLMAAEARR
jgi:hypothetical protein